LAPRLKEKPSCPAFRHAVPVILNAVRHAVSQLHNLAIINTMRPATAVTTNALKHAAPQ